jgi:hypothetical protein
MFAQVPDDDIKALLSKQLGQSLSLARKLAEDG